MELLHFYSPCAGNSINLFFFFKVLSDLIFTNIMYLACALYGAGALDLVPIRKIKTCFNGLLLALGLTYISQFLNDMTIRALVVSFIPAAWFTLTYRLKKPKDGVVLSFIKLVLEIILTIAIAGGIQYVIKMLIQGMSCTEMS